MIEKPLETLATQGVLGALLVVALIVIWWLDRDRTRVTNALLAEKETRVQDSKEVRTLLLQVTKSDTENIQKLADITEFYERNVKKGGE